MRTAITAWAATIVAALSASHAAAFEIEESPTSTHVTQRDVTTYIDINDQHFTLTEVPPDAQQLQVFEQLPEKIAKRATPVPFGLDLTDQDVSAVLEAWYHETAIDYSTLKIRNLIVVGRRYVTWCEEPNIFGCIGEQLRTGTMVTYEVNGANRSGGMTGFQPRIVMMRKTGESAPP